MDENNSYENNPQPPVENNTTEQLQETGASKATLQEEKKPVETEHTPVTTVSSSPIYESKPRDSIKTKFKKFGIMNAVLLFFGGVACGAVFNELVQDNHHHHNHPIMGNDFKRNDDRWDRDDRNGRDYRNDRNRRMYPMDEQGYDSRNFNDRENNRNYYIPEQAPQGVQPTIPQDLDHRKLEPNQGKVEEKNNPTPPTVKPTLDVEPKDNKQSNS